MSAFCLRPRSDDDLDACVRVLRAVHEQRGYPVNWPADPAGWLEGTPAWVAVEGTDASATLVGHVAVTADADAALVERLFVDPSCTGRGVGRGLLRHALDEAKTLSSSVFLDVVAADDAANGLYRADGWTEISRTPIEWGADASARLIRFQAPLAVSR